MVTELSIQPAAAADGMPSLRGGANAAGSTAARAAGAASLQVPVAASNEQALHTAVSHAASALYGDREVDVASFHDESTGRMVHRITDRHSGRVLMQSPSEDLLRFYASTRASADRPLLAIDA